MVGRRDHAEFVCKRIGVDCNGVLLLNCMPERHLVCHDTVRDLCRNDGADCRMTPLDTTDGSMVSVQRYCIFMTALKHLVELHRWVLCGSG